MAPTTFKITLGGGKPKVHIIFGPLALHVDERPPKRDTDSKGLQWRGIWRARGALMEWHCSRSLVPPLGCGGHISGTCLCLPARVLFSSTRHSRIDISFVQHQAMAAALGIKSGRAGGKAGRAAASGDLRLRLSGGSSSGTAVVGDLRSTMGKGKGTAVVKTAAQSSRLSGRLGGKFLALPLPSIFVAHLAGRAS